MVHKEFIEKLQIAIAMRQVRDEILALPDSFEGDTNISNLIYKMASIYYYEIFNCFPEDSTIDVEATAVYQSIDAIMRHLQRIRNGERQEEVVKGLVKEKLEVLKWLESQLLSIKQQLNS